MAVKVFKTLFGRVLEQMDSFTVVKNYGILQKGKFFMSAKPSSQAFKLSAGLLLLLTQLAACGQPSQSITPPNPTQNVSPQSSAKPSNSSQTIFASARSKRTLSLESLSAGSSILPASNGISSPATTPSAAPTAMASSLPYYSPGYASGGPMSGYGGSYYPFSGAGDFNAYLPIQVEENIFAGNGSNELLDVHAQTLKPILSEWDPQARLVESRGNTVPGSVYNSNYEYIQVPTLTNEQPIQVRPIWVFRFASTPLKETLTVYVMQKETRVYRVIWSEPNLDLNKVKVSVTKAREIAAQALADKQEKPGYPVYPDSSAFIGSGAEIIYTLPNDLNWNVSLGQQGSQLVYYLYASYREDVTRPGVPMAFPQSQPSGFVITQVLEPSPSPEMTPIPTAFPTPSPTPFPVITPTPTPTAMPTGSPVPYPDCMPEYARYLYINVSLSIDAVSGKVLNLNRPIRSVNHNHYFGPDCHAPGASPYPTPTPMAWTSAMPSASAR